MLHQSRLTLSSLLQKFMKSTALCLLLPLLFAQPLLAEEKPVDGQYPPLKAPEGKWENLLSGNLTDGWTGMSMSISSPLITTAPNPDKPGEYILHIDRGPTGLIRSMKAYENFILEMEWRHLTEAPSAGGGKGTSGNSGLLICHGAFPKTGGPYPPEGHEVQVCNLGNGDWYTSHGDLFTLPGTNSQAIPDPRFAVSHACGHRSMPVAFHGSKTGEWNKVRITCVDGTLQQEVNGALVTSLYRISPRKGYMSFESEGGAVEFKNMRLQELAPDPELAAKHIAPMLPEPMKGDYITERTAKPLPEGNFIAVVDAKKPVSPAALFEGLGLPDGEVTGRIVVTKKDGNVSATNADKPLGDAKALPAGAKGTLHLELNPGSLGHVLVLTPVK